MFEMRLEVVRPLKRGTSLNFFYDESLDDYRSVLTDICNLLEDTGQVRFIVSAFDDRPWRVDCRCDLLVIMEQMPSIIEQLAEGNYDFRLDFYEQGIERELVFNERDECVHVTCISRTEWMPNSETLMLSKQETADILLSLYDDFLDAALQVCPRLCRHPLMKDFLVLQTEGNGEKGRDA